MNEAGSRFAPGMMGSSAFTGAKSVADYFDARDASGVAVRERPAAARTAFPDVSLRPLGEQNAPSKPGIKHLVRWRYMRWNYRRRRGMMPGIFATFAPPA